MTLGGLYLGKVHHARVKPRRHRLAYRVFMLLVDIDELAERTGLRLFSHNHFNLISLHDRDHGDGSGGPLRPQIEDRIRGAGLTVPGGAIQMLSMPRVLGHGFNPLSVYYCHDRAGALAVIVYEVNNTFGGRHSYVLPAQAHDGRVSQACGKAFFVSQFMDMALRYAFDIVPPAERALVGIQVSDAEGPVLSASFAGEHRDLTDAALFAAWAGHPMQTIGVLAAIYWQGFKLVLKGFRWRSPNAAETRAEPGQVLPHGASAVAKPQ